MAMLSVIGLYNYDEKIFNGIKPYLPEEPSDKTIATESEPMNFELLMQTILLKAGELSLVYTEPKLFKLMVNLWAARNRLVWQNLYDTTYYKYDPLFSKIRAYTLDRKTVDNLDKEIIDSKTETTSQKTDNNKTVDTTGNENANITDSVTTDENMHDSFATNKNKTDTLYKQAFNDININAWYGKDKTVSTETDGGNETKTTGTTTNGTTNNDRDFVENVVDKLHGVLTRDITTRFDEFLKQKENGTLQDVITETVKGQKPFQELIQLQRELVEFNLYDYIADDFVKNFCVMIY